MQQLLESLGLINYGIFHFNDIKFLDSIVTDIFNGAKADNPSTRLKNSSKLFNLLIEVKNLARENNSNYENINYEKLKPVLSFIESNYNKNLSIDDMSSFIKVSPQYLCRLFKKNMNMRPFTYLTKYRLQKAKEMLLNNMEMKIGTIYTEVGYNDESYFCALFKKNEGVTPSEFRNLNRL
ncbi:MAG: helix-turn-helix transcriptional regulator [Clostridiaceae bacterium]|nr:helix-turn-helix transcriptional regulator [Clostridiaceae bacterium]